MEKKKVSITMISRQHSQKGEPEDEINFFTIGEYYQDQGTHVINYEESQVSGLEGTTTTLKVKEDSVILERAGNYYMSQIFRVDQKEYTIYKTPYGEFLVEIVPTIVESNWTKEGGQINLLYCISVGGRHLGQHFMSINIADVPN